MQHRGRIIEQAIRESGIPISRIAELMGRSRRWMYLLFENEHVSLDHLLTIGELIQVDFSNEIPELAYLIERSEFSKEIPVNNNDYLFWKMKYFHLLEEYFQASRRVHARILLQSEQIEGLSRNLE